MRICAKSRYCFLNGALNILRHIVLIVFQNLLSFSWIENFYNRADVEKLRTLMLPVIPYNKMHRFMLYFRDKMENLIISCLTVFVVARASSSLQIAFSEIFVSRWVAIYLFCYIILQPITTGYDHKKPLLNCGIVFIFDISYFNGLVLI